jgi:hypothetical protein
METQGFGYEEVVEALESNSIGSVIHRKRTQKTHGTYIAMCEKNPVVTRVGEF